MKLDLRTLTFILSLTCITQVVALFIQYLGNRIYRGIEWWLMGSLLMAAGFITLSIGTAGALGNVGQFGNPLLILGRGCLLIGTLRFINKKENLSFISAATIIFISLYYYFLYGNPSIGGRTILVSSAISIYSYVIAYQLISKAHPYYSGAAKFTGSIFTIHASYLAVMIIYTIFSNPMRTYADFAPIQTAVFVVPLITSTLWTYGFILMVNQRLAAENLEEKETYCSILNASPDAITITDLEGRILMASPAANTMFGFEPGEEQGRRINEFLVPEDLERAQANIREMYQASHHGPNEYTGIRKGGSPFDIEVNSGLIRGTSGQPIKRVFIVRDITERKRAEVERMRLETQNRQLQKAESLGRMAGAIAHHFNNKLQTVMASLELLGGGAGTHTASRHLAVARQATEGAAAISRLLLVYLGQASDERTPHLLSNLCQDALLTIQDPNPGSLALEAHWPWPGPVVQANADQIMQVLANLVHNAQEASGEGKGPIRLALHTCAPGEIPSRHRFPIDWQPRPVDYACLEVADRGQGIPASDIEKVFDPFFSTKFSGRGLGLPVVLGIVQAHGGAVTVQSEPGQGSVFRVYLPLSAEAIPQREQPLFRVPGAPGTGTILLVDDDEGLLHATREMIEMLGHTVLVANDGFEALEVFERHPGEIQCVITDLTMPRMDGWATLGALRQRRPDLPVILASGYDKAHVMAGTHLEQPQDFLGKPYRLQDLRDALERALADGGRVSH